MDLKKLKSIEASIAEQGYLVLESVFSRKWVQEARDRLYPARDQIFQEMSEERRQRAGEDGILRLIAAADPWFLKILEAPEILQVVDQVLSPTAILHLQNGFILEPSVEKGVNFQHHFHRDFPRVLNGYLCSLNMLVTVSEFTSQNGGTLVLPGSHQKADFEPENSIGSEIAIECPAGSILIFDSTLFHCSGHNQSGQDRLAINHQFTCSYFKQQIDYVRALKEHTSKVPERTFQLLGGYTRVPSSLDEFYQPEDRRFYRRGQG